MIDIKEIIKNIKATNSFNLDSESLIGDKVIIASYPKSGNTWLRFLIASMMGERPDFENIRKIIPSINSLKSQDIRNINKNTRFLTTHLTYQPYFKSAIYIYRDPRAVALSYFFYLKKYNRIDVSFEHFLSKFINGDIDNDINFGTWAQNICSWLCNESITQDNIIILNYEDLLENTYKYVVKINSFFNLELSDNELKKAIDNTCFESMQKIEQNQKNEIKKWKNSNQSINFVRSGKVDEWKDYFTKEMEDLMYLKWGTIIDKCGYKKFY